MNDATPRQEDRVRVAVAGARGRMGSLTCRSIAGDGQLLLAAAIDPAFGADGNAVNDEWRGRPSAPCFRSVDEALAAESGFQVMVDFSVPGAVVQNVLTCVRRRVAVVVGTTGLAAADLLEIAREVETHGAPVLVVPNFAMGAVLMTQFARQAAHHFEACEIVELHHKDKLDAPSGTSRLTRLRIEETWRESGLDREVPVHSVRLPGLVAHQEVIFGGLGETLTIRHDSLSRESFMPGVLLAVKRVRSLQGVVVGLENIL